MKNLALKHCSSYVYILESIIFRLTGEQMNAYMKEFPRSRSKG